jgi:hypothetical protein
MLSGRAKIAMSEGTRCLTSLLSYPLAAAHGSLFDTHASGRFTVVLAVDSRFASLASGMELLVGDAKPPVRRRTDSGRSRTDRVAANAADQTDALNARATSKKYPRLPDDLP